MFRSAVLLMALCVAGCDAYVDAFIYEKQIKAIELAGARDGVISLTVTTENRGCGPEHFSHFEKEIEGNAAVIRAFYVEDSGTGPCVVWDEYNNLLFAQLTPGVYTIVANQSFPGDELSLAVELP